MHKFYDAVEILSNARGYEDDDSGREELLNAILSREIKYSASSVVQYSMDSVFVNPGLPSPENLRISDSELKRLIANPQPLISGQAGNIPKLKSNTPTQPEITSLGDSTPPLPDDAKPEQLASGTSLGEQHNQSTDNAANLKIAKLFPLAAPAALEKMFPSNGLMSILLKTM